MFETISGRDSEMTIPVVQKTVPISTYTTYSLNDSCIYEQTTEYYIPDTEEGVTYNEEFVQQARASTPGTITLDENHYVTVTTKMRYSFYPSLDNKLSDYMVSIDWVAITKDRSADRPGGYLVEIRTPTVHVLQLGPTEYSEKYVAQEISEKLSWGESGLSMPNNWVSIITPYYSNLSRCYAEFTVDFIYYSSGVDNYTLSNSFSLSPSK